MLDATLGGGGHSAAIAQALIPGGTLIGLDRDSEALESAEQRLAPLRTHLNIILLHSDFGNLSEALTAAEGSEKIRLDGALFDLGVSSRQLDSARGFSFRRDEPLNMLMDTRSGPTAADFLAEADEAEIARVLWEYGEERWAKRIAKRVVEQRSRGEKIETTGQFATLIERSIPRAAWPKDIHVATRAFQGVRIAVNGELEQLEAGLEAAMERLKLEGRLVVLSYHSLEDRIVKHKFAAWAGRVASASGYSPAALLPTPADRPLLHLLTRKPVQASEAEIAQNPRARSAKLRAAQRTA